jgi:hypothetical protein
LSCSRIEGLTIHNAERSRRALEAAVRPGPGSLRSSAGASDLRWQSDSRRVLRRAVRGGSLDAVIAGDKDGQQIGEHALGRENEHNVCQSEDGCQNQDAAIHHIHQLRTLSSLQSRRTERECGKVLDKVNGTSEEEYDLNLSPEDTAT